MANSVEIPQDIIDNVIVALGNDTPSLKQCALVSSSFLLPSRKQLFYSIRFGFNNEACHKLHQFFVQNPVIISFVRRIKFHPGWDYTPLFDKLLLAILQLPFCHLEEFSLDSMGIGVVNWTDLSGELKDALSTLIHSPTLKILHLRYVDNAPVTLFLGIVQLLKLHLSSVSLNYSDGEQPSSLIPKGVATTASHTVIDRCVWFFNGSTPGYPTEGIFLPFMSYLRILEIDINPHSATMSDFAVLSFVMRSLCASLTSPATLEHLKLNIKFEGYDNNFQHYPFYDDLRDDDVWGLLDSIVTHPTGSRLQRVNIDIIYCFCYDADGSNPDNDDILEAVLDSLPLLHEKGILFLKANPEW
ncbi:uncharacterized protein LACBIDRAFT_326852 [Laccaria bicolor S238N-H82]|uniref:Predicted protein n=1 Tax=Laccaria bicolor (strain S238N-H82 / ATCC MYA-4686) TaxID=486041 RepID=B0D9W5_LACBS|nr:uncharacterized protein LACBIDRAFT_326852 [Laccaria bicolor S238N-H82]EDR08418.1 predicted protein [Laccaria bicolor S238N-H82]|eukprot:XP_001880643.1 predicted protein [Laccaria bicolor S238N-H82]